MENADLAAGVELMPELDSSQVKKMRPHLFRIFNVSAARWGCFTSMTFLKVIFDCF